MAFIDRLIESLILLGVWFEVWLEWKNLTYKRRESIMREVNKAMKKLGITVGLMLLSFRLSDASTFAQWGIASAHPSESSRSLVKFAELGATGEHGKLAYTVGIGGWVDRSGYKGKSLLTKYTEKASDSGFVEALFGVDPQCGPFYLTYKLGPAFITKTDSLLGSNLQVGHELGIGLRDTRGVRMGIVFKHISNAGLVLPNLGRDFVGLRIQF